MKLPDGWVLIAHMDAKAIKVDVEKRELVMCRNCKHYETEAIGIGIGWCNELAIAQDGEFWCKKGEKRSDDKSVVC